MASLQELILRIAAQGGAATRSEINQLNRAIRETSTQTSTSTSTMGKFGAGLQNVGGKMQNVGRTLTENVTKNIVGLGIEAIQSAMGFESGMLRVQAMAGASAKDTEMLGEKAKEMGAKTKFSAVEASDAFYYMASAGWKTNDMMGAIEGTMNLAAASGEDLALTTDIVTTAIGAFNLKTTEASRIADLLANTARNSKTNVAILGESFKYVAPIAGSVGYKIEDVATALGLMSQAGIVASQAGTTLRSAMVNLAKPTVQGSKYIKDLGIHVANSKGQMLPFADVMVQLRTKFKGLNQVQKEQAAAAIFGKTAMAGMLKIISASDADFNKITKATNNYTGAAKEMADIQMTGLSGQITVLKSMMEGAAIKIGNLLLPYVKQLVKFLQTLTGRFSKLSPTIQRIIIVIGLIAAAIGPVLIAGGMLISLIGGVITTVTAISGAVAAAGGITAFLGGIAATAAPILGVVAAIAALVGIVVLIITRMFSWKQIMDGLKSAWNGVVNVFKTVVNFLVGVFTPVVDAFKKTYMSIDTKAISESFNQLKGSLGPLIEVLKALGIVIGAIVAVQIGILIGLWNGLLAAISPFISMLMNLIGIVTSVFGIIVGIFTGDTEMIKQSIGSLVDNVIGFFYNLGATVVNLVMGFVNGIVSFFKGLYNTIVGNSIIPDMVNAIISWFTNLVNTGVALISSIVNRVISLFRTLLSTAISIASSIYSGVVNAFARLVSGIAGKVGSAVSAATNLINGVKNSILGVASSAYNWGANLINSFINGITSKVAAVASAASNIVGTVKSFLGFQSPAEEGPGKEADKWAPNLMKMVTKGLTDGIPEITRASDMIAAKLNFIPDRQASGNSNSSVTNQNVYISIDAAHMSVDELGTALVGKLQSYGIKPKKG
jgi:TP901 family phage tail tape measure protein